MCFCHNFEKTIALNSDKSLQTSNPSSRLTNFLLKTKHCKNCQSCHSQNSCSVKCKSRLVVPFTSLVSLVYAVSLLVFVCIGRCIYCVCIIWISCISKILETFVILSHVSLTFLLHKRVTFWQLSVLFETQLALL